MKKIIALAVFILFLFLAAKAVIWSSRFLHETTLDSSDGRTNILILGIGGGTHEGFDLTDTIMVLSLDSSKKSVALISIPRDIWSDTLKDKVNTAYHYGQLKQKSGGLLLSKVIMEDVIGMPIHYALVIDFSGFTKVIDAVGGIDVNVPEAFTDTQYPKPGMEQSTCPGDPTNACVYETVHFDAGLQHMDGARALIYARSRHAEGDQGSDFARSRRQQIIMVALKDRFTHPTQWVTLSRLEALPKLLDDATDMDMTLAQAVTVGRRFASTNQDQIKKVVFDQLLDNPPAYLYNNLYVLIPHTSWDDIHAYIKAQL
jgi:LCP family protein required for cell wall assembly